MRYIVNFQPVIDVFVNAFGERACFLLPGSLRYQTPFTLMALLLLLQEVNAKINKQTRYFINGIEVDIPIVAMER